ncbi:hypothetical protein ACH5RR_033265 [Cinchona calisaya]|uniref:DUF7081 domain-containing protein n=1 Tax=Cinchona calisaya TaxID=153742 RepID=A0ABD2YKH5_9GENT
MKTDVSKAGNGCIPSEKKSEVLSTPVSLCSSGKGLPYAPVDWPNVGDIWGWRVGSRVKASGFYNDRFLYAPKSLQEKPSRQLVFQSKPSLLRYLQSAFPELDINAFLASFTWDIPAEACSSKVGKSSPIPKSLPSEKAAGKVVRRGGVFKRTRKAKLKKPSCKSTKHSDIEIILDVSPVEERTFGSDPTTKVLGTSSQVSNSHATVFPDDTACHSPIDLKPQGLKPHNKSQAGLTPEDFDNFLDSLDEILSLPIARAELSSLSPLEREGMAETRAKLSSLLAIGFSSLVASNKINELTALASKLKNDPALTLGELSMLNLILEVPLTSNSFLEAKKLSEQADKFFADLEAKMANVASLRTEYNKAKQQLELSQAEEASALLALLEIDEQIAALQSRRATITQTVKQTNKKIVQYSSTQKRVMECLPKIVHEVQLANSEKQEWELKKKKAAEREAEFLAKFAPLGGFSF